MILIGISSEIGSKRQEEAEERGRGQAEGGRQNPSGTC